MCGGLLLFATTTIVFFYMSSLPQMTFYSDDFSSTSSLSSSSPLVHPQETYKFKSQPMTNERIKHLKGPNGPKFTVLVTGAAGFVGMHTALALQELGMTPIGYDNVNNYYSVQLKESRIDELKRRNINFVRGDVCDETKLKETILQYNITRFIHLAAQAGVRYSLDHPLEYTRNNVDCTVMLLQVMVDMGFKHDPLVYASSSSVYGNNVKIPFQETDRVEDPASLYAATKRSDELITHTYFNLHNISSIGLRFFTVYGPYGRYVSVVFLKKWFLCECFHSHLRSITHSFSPSIILTHKKCYGSSFRPDMAPWIFTDKISNGEAIRVFNHGQSRRDFTYVDDIVQGVVHSLFVNTGQPELVNLGNGRPVVLADFVRIVEEKVGKQAQIQSVGMQKGDVPTTFADISKARRLLGYHPTTTIEEGIEKFVTWFQQHDASKYRMED
jgi:UDP-glucuronate 4-epimerase